VPPPKKQPGKITPLWIVSSFVTFTEVALSYAVTKVTGWPQQALTVFVMVFALAVAAAFFLILWNRPYVFYSPSEYGDVDPKDFISTLREVSPKVADLALTVEQDPLNLDARFSLVDAMADEVECQYLILMRELGKDVAKYGPYVYRSSNGGGGSGYLGGFSNRDRLEGAGMVMRTGGGGFVRPTEDGLKFADWLVSKGRKCPFFWCPAGGWGALEPGSVELQWMEDQKKQHPRFFADERGQGAS